MAIDTMKPLDIAEDEELERISGLLQRDNLVRGLGIVEHVYRMLHCSMNSNPTSRAPQVSSTLMRGRRDLPAALLFLIVVG